MSLEISIAGMVAEAGRLTEAVATKMTAIDAAVAAATQQIDQKWTQQRRATLSAAGSRTLVLDADAGNDAGDGSAAAPIKTVARLRQLLAEARPVDLHVVMRAAEPLTISAELAFTAGRLVEWDLSGLAGGLTFAARPIVQNGVDYGVGLWNIVFDAPVVYVYGRSAGRTKVTVPASQDSGQSYKWWWNYFRTAFRYSGSFWRAPLSMTFAWLDVSVGAGSVLLSHATGANVQGANQLAADLRCCSVDSSFAVAAGAAKQVGWTDLDTPAS